MHQTQPELRNLLWPQRRRKTLLSTQYHEASSFCSAQLFVFAQTSMQTRCRPVRRYRKYHVKAPPCLGNCKNHGQCLKMDSRATFRLRISSNESQIKCLSIGHPPRPRIPPPKFEKHKNTTLKTGKCGKCHRVSHVNSMLWLDC